MSKFDRPFAEVRLYLPLCKWQAKSEPLWQ
jgi:hypothetical protein